jgi:hypothetical protein
MGAVRETSRKRSESEMTEQQTAMVEEAKAECGRDGWLCRFADDRVKGEAPRDSRVKGEAPRDSRVKSEAPRDSLAEEGTGAHTVLGMGFADYLELLEWTGRCVVEGRVKGEAPRDSRVKGDAPRVQAERGVLPESARPVLERMELDVENWVETVEQYGSIYYRVAGKVENLKRKAQEMGRQWLAGQRKSRGVFRLPRGGRGREAKGRHTGAVAE